jgi:hypothetical protein
MLALVTTPIVEAPTVTPRLTPTLEEPTATAVATATRPAPTATQRAPTATRAPTRTRVVTAVAIATRVPTRTPTSQGSDACLLDKVIAANQVFDRWGREGFEPAIELYQSVLTDATSKACGRTADESSCRITAASGCCFYVEEAGNQAERLRQIGDARLKGAVTRPGWSRRRRAALPCRLTQDEGNRRWRWRRNWVAGQAGRRVR